MSTLTVSRGGLAFRLGPREALLAPERDLMEGDGPEAVHDVQLLASPPWTADVAAFPDHAPADVSVVGDRVRVTHRRLMADIDLAAGHTRVWRPAGDGLDIDVVLRTLLALLLPARGGVPLHAAGVAVDGQGVAFFGPSGAGKSTLAATSPHPVFSDEMVVAHGRPFALERGFKGSVGEHDAPAPLRLLVELRKGPALDLQPLPPVEALRRIMGCVLVPLHTGTWGHVLGVLDRLVHEVPAVSMAWSPQAPPWADVGRLLAGPYLATPRNASMGSSSRDQVSR